MFQTPPFIPLFSRIAGAFPGVRPEGFIRVAGARKGETPDGFQKTGLYRDAVVLQQKASAFQQQVRAHMVNAGRYRRESGGEPSRGNDFY